jgi:hypothetical protein
MRCICVNWTQLIRYRFQYLDSCENACESSGPMTDGQLLDQMSENQFLMLHVVVYI